MKPTNAAYWGGWVTANLVGAFVAYINPLPSSGLITPVQWSLLQALNGVLLFWIIWGITLALRVLPKYTIRIERKRGDGQ